MFRRASRRTAPAHAGALAATAVLALTLATVPPADAYESDGLIIYLDAGVTSSYSGTGLTWTDLSGNGNNGTLTNVTFDNSEKAFVFAGGTNGTSYVDLAGNYNDFSDGITVEFEAKFDASTAAWARIFDFAAALDNDPDIGAAGVADAFWVGQMNSSGELAVEVFVGGVRKGYCYTATGGTAIDASAYAKWTLTIDDSAVCRWFKNGTQVPTRLTLIGTSFNTSPTGADADGSQLQALPAVTTRESAFVGRSNFVADRDLIGRVRYLRIYDRDLNASEVSNNATPAPVYTVTFDANMGSGTMPVQASSSPITLRSNTFSRTGYAFSGWATNADGSGTTYADSAIFPFAADTTLFAQWSVPASPTAPAASPRLDCTPNPAPPGSTVTCTVTAGPAGFDILWRAIAGDRTRATSGVSLDGSGSGVFAFAAPSDLAGSTMSVELVDWGVTDDVSLVGPTPTAIPAGSGSPSSPLVFLLPVIALTGIAALRASAAQGTAR